MPNHYVRKTNRGMVSMAIYELAYEQVLIKGSSIRSAALAHKLSNVSLRRFIRKKKAYEANLTDKPPSVGYNTQKVFTEQEEDIICYLLTSAASNCGLTSKEARKLAYMFAKKHAKNFPPSWENNKMAGGVWLRMFMKRHPKFSLRLKPMDYTIFDNLKNAINAAYDNWVRLNPGKEMTISDMPSITQTAFAIEIAAKNISDDFAAIDSGTDKTEEGDILPSEFVDCELFTPVQNRLEDKTPVTCPSAVEVDNINEPVASSSEVHRTRSKISLVKQYQKRKVKSPMVTDSPVTAEITNIEVRRKKKRKGNELIISKKELTANSEENDLCSCSVEFIVKVSSDEKWLQCIDCKDTHHKACSRGRLYYICENCISD